MNKPIAVLAISASVLAGGAGGAVLSTPDLVGAQEEATTSTTGDPSSADDGTPSADEDRRAARSARILEELAGLVEDGTITQAQAEAVADALVAADQRLRGGHGHGRRGSLRLAGAAVARALGMTAAELHRALAEGSTIAAVAAERGVARQAVIDAVVAEIGDRLDEAVADGRLTEAEAAERRAEAAGRAADLVDGLGRHGPHHHRDPGDEPPDTTDTTRS